MRRILAIMVAGLVLFVGSYSGASAQEDAAREDAAREDAALGRALDVMKSQDWEAALAEAGPRDSVARDIISWHWLREGMGTAEDARAFLERRPDWPGLNWLRRKSEPSFAGEAPETIMGFFEPAEPQTAEGVLILAGALQSMGRSGEAQANIVTAWRSLPMGTSVQAQYLANYADLLKPHHNARLDRMIWDGHMVSARLALPLVDDDHRALANARIALLNLGGNVDTLIAQVPDSLREDPGLAHARFVWRHRKGREESAIDLALAQSAKPDLLGEPDKWARRRRDLARWEMRNGSAERAYKLASQHFLTPEAGYAYADLEWISGYVALTKLNDAATAIEHFKRFEAAVDTPISKGRAGYWMGRAYAALNKPEEAHAAYALGARYQTSFYGLLAAEQIGRPFDPALAVPEKAPPWRDAPFMSSTVTHAALLLLANDEINLAERFLTHLVETLPREQAIQLGDMVIDMGHPHLAVMIAKRAARQGVVLPAAYYPLHPLVEKQLPMAQEMTLAIARRESEFDPVVISGAGARGLMQVMPATAKLVAKDIGILSNHSTALLTSDWAYNAKLGATYLAELAGEFQGNVVMVSAGYNAGPGRPTRWMQTYGDPRTGTPDIVDWIEHIPFNETRNYVMRVTESLPVYRARLGQEALPIPFSDELIGSTLLPFAP